MRLSNKNNGRRKSPFVIQKEKRKGGSREGRKNIVKKSYAWVLKLTPSEKGGRGGAAEVELKQGGAKPKLA